MYKELKNLTILGFLTVLGTASAFAGDVSVAYQCKTSNPSSLDSIEILKKLGGAGDSAYVQYVAISTFISDAPAITGPITNLSGPFLFPSENFPLEYRVAGFLLTIHTDKNNQLTGTLTTSFQQCSGGCATVPVNNLSVQCSKIQ